MFHAVGKDPTKLYILILGVLISIGIINGIVGYFFGEGDVFYRLHAVLTHAMVGDDSWWPMYKAANARWEYPGVGIYEAVFFGDNVKFQYPPIALLPYIVLIELGYGLPAILKISHIISFCALIGVVFCGYKIIIVILDKYAKDYSLSTSKRLSIFIATILAVFTFYPLINAQYLGQAQMAIDLLICVAFLAWLVERKYLAGSMIALASLIKPTLMLVLIWAIMRKEKACIIGMMVIFVPAGILSLAVFGFDEHLDYLRVLSHIGSHGESYRSNQSINGILNRLLLDVDIGSFDNRSYSTYNPYVHAGTLISTILFILFGLFYNKPKAVNNTGSALDLGTMVSVSVMAAPTVWSHHYGVMWPVLIMALMIAITILNNRQSYYTSIALPLLFVGYFLMSNYFILIDNEALYPSPINLVLSYFLYGGIISVIALVLLRHAAADGAAESLSDGLRQRKHGTMP
jgi:hypothetical protein